MSAIEKADAKELTAEEQQQRAAACFQIETSIKSAIAEGKKALWDLAENLYLFDEESGWTALGYENQAEWLAQPDIGITRTAYFRLVRKWRELVIFRKLPITKLVELDGSKVDIVMPAIEGKAIDINTIIEDVQELGARDLREKYVKAPSAPSTPPPDGGADDDTGGKTIETDAKPTKAADVKPAPVEDGTVKGTVSYSLLAVDSFVSVGGDRRKAQRNYRRLWEVHPVLQALTALEAFLQGAEDAPDRAGAQEAWETLQASGFELPTT